MSTGYCEMSVFHGLSGGGPRRIDRRRPYVVRLKLDLPAGKRGRVYARIFYTRGGSKRVRSKTVSRTFTICG